MAAIPVRICDDLIAAESWLVIANPVVGHDTVPARKGANHRRCARRSAREIARRRGAGTGIIHDDVTTAMGAVVNVIVIGCFEEALRRMPINVTVEEAAELTPATLVRELQPLPAYREKWSKVAVQKAAA